jgi:hypothetical protein
VARVINGGPARDLDSVARPLVNAARGPRLERRQVSVFFEDDRPTDGFAAWFEDLAATASEDDLFGVLASKRPPTSRLARQQIRGRLVTLLGAKFKEFGSGAAAARTADAWLQEGGDLELQGQDFVVEEVEPWGSTVAGADVLDEVEALVDAYVYATRETRDALTLWDAYTHVFDCLGRDLQDVHGGDPPPREIHTRWTGQSPPPWRLVLPKERRKSPHGVDQKRACRDARTRPDVARRRDGARADA